MRDTIVEIKRIGGVARVRLLSGETLKIPSALFLMRRLRAGQEIDTEEYRQYILKNGYSPALETAVSYLTLRERSEQEIVARLKRSCYPEEIIARVMETLRKHDFVSDARFAEQWVHHRARQYGRNRISQELKMKGVGSAEAGAALENLPPEEELASAEKQAKKIARRLHGDETKIAQALVRRGYGWPVARQAARKTVQNEDE